MTLDTFRKEKGWSFAHLARQLGASHATVARRWCLPRDHKNRLIPSPVYMDRIIVISSGKVMPNDFYVNRS